MWAPLICLTGTISPELAKLTFLTRLDLSLMKRLSGSLPPQLASLKKLVHFDVATNKLSGSIPKAYGGFTSLKWLSLGDNM